MAREQNTFLKRQREMEKKRKAEEKRTRRQKKKEDVSGSSEPDAVRPSATEQ